MKYFVKHFEGGFPALEKEGDDEIAIASFHKDPQTQTGLEVKGAAASGRIRRFSQPEGLGG